MYRDGFDEYIYVHTQSMIEYTLHLKHIEMIYESQIMLFVRHCPVGMFFHDHFLLRPHYFLSTS